jgi:diguanylate cyclase (GGDEF)-like protein/PAS domain S-box-containing protein
MRGEPLDQSTLDNALHAVLDRYPTALLFALNAAAVRVPLPADGVFSARAELPGRDATVVDFVVAADRMTVVKAWERVKATGLAQEQVRMASDPEHTYTFTLIDCRHRFGVWIGTVVAENDQDNPGTSATADPSLLTPSRPRTAALHKNLYGIITDIDARCTAMLGWTREDMIGRRSLEFLHPDDHERAIGQWLEMRARRATQRVRVRHRHSAGHWLWVEVENTFVGLDDPDTLVAISQLTDISDEMAAHEAVRAQEQLFHRLTESLPVGVVQLDTDHRVVYANTRLAALLGVAALTEDTTIADLISTVDITHRLELTDALTAATAHGVDSAVEVDLIASAAAERCRCLFTIAALAGEQDHAGAIVSVTDITDGALLREELRIKATYDPLTGCLNRAAILAELDQALTTSDAGPIAVIFVDLVRFKTVNDTYGHLVGDQLLTITGHRLLAQARHADRVGRLGGDEFLLVCPGVSDPSAALNLAHRVHQHLHGPVDLDGRQLHLAASIGVTLAHPGSPADRALTLSDQAMYEAKHHEHGPVLTPPPASTQPATNQPLTI